MKSFENIYNKDNEFSKFKDTIDQTYVSLETDYYAIYEVLNEQRIAFQQLLEEDKEAFLQYMQDKAQQEIARATRIKNSLAPYLEMME